MVEEFNTVIVGGGQAALALSYHLRDRRRPHVILERARVAERWRTERWNSLAFQMPNWSLQLPGMAYNGNDPDGFAHHSDILRFIEDYAHRIDAPVRTSCTVTRLQEDGKQGYVLETSDGTISARNVVIATGPFHRPAIPEFASLFPSTVYQVDAARYKSPDELPTGTVWVVGSGSSGTQIADELVRAGRRVFLSVGRHRYAPRRYRGLDVIWWYDKLGRFDIPIDTFPDRKFPPPTVMTGVDGGYDLFPRTLENNGCNLIGRMEGIANNWVMVADDVNDALEAADKGCADFIVAADALAEKLGLEPRSSSDAVLPPPSKPACEPVFSVNLSDENITAVIWAAGYGYNYDWVQLPIFDSDGAPVQSRSVTACPGVYFLGLHWMHTFRSGLLSYVGQDAEYVADHMDRQRR